LTITALPQPHLNDWLRRRGPFGVALDRYTSLHASGRGALYWAFRSLHLDARAVVWMPAYHCGAEVQAALDAGLDVGFYRVGPDLAVDVDDLERRLRQRAGPVVVIHYFGFGQPGIAAIDELCRRQRIPWLEDCAHALFSDHEGAALGTVAPLSIFSLRKTLPLFEGGALQFNPERLSATDHAPPAPGHFPLSAAPLRLSAVETVRQLIGDRPFAWYRRARGHEVLEPTEWTDAFQERHRYPHGLAGISRRMAASFDPARVAERRRANWLDLDRHLERTPGYCKVFDTLPAGVCPLFLPIRVSRRKPLMEALRAQAIETFAFGACHHPRLDPMEFPEADRLRHEIVCLPVHQALTAPQVERIAAAARPLIAKYGTRSGSAAP
jgi:dTDP-4-amino-4,6-dideoxygalactose transaminase